MFVLDFEIYIDSFRNQFKKGVKGKIVLTQGQILIDPISSIMWFFRENDANTTKPSYIELKEKLNDVHAKINVVCNDAVHSSDFFESFVECNRCLDLFAIGVHEKYQRKGIASKLMLESIKVLMNITVSA